MKRLISALCMTGALGAALVSGQAMAWGDQGHRAIGAIAGQLLVGTNAEKQIAALLLPGESLELSTVWADCVKGTFCGPQTEEMVAYTTANPLHGEYHYTNTPLQRSGYTAGGVGTSPHDIVQMLQQSIAVLQGRIDPLSNPHNLTRRQALLLLAHLASDIHQPLHVGSIYLDKNSRVVEPQTQAQVDGVNIFDMRGDNQLFFADPAYDRSAYPNQPVGTQNLHFFWDITTVENVYRHTGVKNAAEFAQVVTAQKRDVDLNVGEPASWPKQWADDGLTIARLAHQGVQAGPSKSNVDRRGATYLTWPITVPADYLESSTTTASAQLVRGGYHFAALLQKIWP
jgi:hypothetical protein